MIEDGPMLYLAMTLLAAPVLMAFWAHRRARMRLQRARAPQQRQPH